LALRVAGSSIGENPMKTVLSAAAGILALVAMALPAAAASDQPGTNGQGSSAQQNAPGHGGTSKPGIAGKPGSKSGPTARHNKNGSTAGSGSSTKETVRHQDESKVPGKPGSKSGPTVKPNEGPSGSSK
jgi:hypothetical protein